jgi:hypothetical protein
MAEITYYRDEEANKPYLKIAFNGSYSWVGANKLVGAE